MTKRNSIKEPPRTPKVESPEKQSADLLSLIKEEEGSLSQEVKLLKELNEN